MTVIKLRDDKLPSGESMYVTIAMSPTPPRDTRIWRYTDLTKLLSLLDSKQLFFASILNMSDLYEGYIPVPNFEQYRDFRLYEQEYAGVTDENVRCVYDWDVKWTKETRKCVFVNCWHENEDESAAMWKLYLSNAEGVAIQSTVGRLIDAISEAPESVGICKVEYVDYTTTPPCDNLWQRAIHKRRSFSHEREVRAIHLKNDHVEKMEGECVEAYKLLAGVPIAANVEALIENIYVAPTCPTWMKNTIQSAVAKFGLNRSVCQSTLGEGPVW